MHALREGSALRRHWLAVIGAVAARDLARGGWRRLAVAPMLAGPAAGDRVVVFATHRPSYVASGIFAGTAEIRAYEAGALLIRHRFVAPVGHEVRARDVTHLHVRAAWTDERVAAALGTLAPIGEADFERVEREIRDRALRYGPAPSRPAHRRPRTPGRRALAPARITARRSLAAR